jgi:hypothetical protein
MRKIVWSTLAALTAATLLAATAVSTAHAAGTVAVNFVKPDDYADIGRSAWDREQALATLKEHFDGLAKRLPDGQTLSIDVLDVELAGRQDPFVFNGARVMKGRADWPHMVLKYELRGTSGVLKAGEARVSDMGYLIVGPSSRFAYGPLPYERQMLTRWFDESIVGSR